MKAGLDAWAPGPRVRAAGVAALALFVGLLVLCWRATGPVLFDSTVTGWLRSRGPETLVDHIANVVIKLTTPGAQVVMGALVAGLVLVIWRDLWWAGVCLVGPALANLSEIVLKHAVDRTRFTDPASPVFPSGHTTGISSRAVAVVLVVWAATACPPLRGAAVALAALATAALAASTIALDHHFPTDALGGALLGTGLMLLLAAIVLGPVREAVRSRRSAHP